MFSSRLAVRKDVDHDHAELRTVADDGLHPAGELRIAVAHSLTELALAGPTMRRNRTSSTRTGSS
jgi:hypothetical protein